MSQAPARVAGVRVPTIKDGEEANLCLADPAAGWTVSRPRCTPAHTTRPGWGPTCARECCSRSPPVTWPSRPVPKAAVIALADGACFRRRGARRRRHRRRRVGVHHRHDRLSGGGHRPLLPRSAGDLHLPTGGQLRRAPGPSESDRVHARAVIAREITNYSFKFAAVGRLARLAGRARCACCFWRRHACSHPPHPAKGALRAVVSTEGAETRRLVKAAKRLPSMAGLDLAQAVTCKTAPACLHPETLDGEATTAARPRTWSPTTSASSATSCAGCSIGLPRHGGAGADLGAARCSSCEPDGVFLSNGPGDPAAVTYAVEAVARLLGKGRSSASAWATSCWRWPRREHLQAQVRPPRRQPAGEGPRAPAGRDHRPEPRLRGRRRRRAAGGRRDHPPQPQRRDRRGPALPPGWMPSRCSTTRRPRPARTTARLSVRALPRPRWQRPKRRGDA